MRNNLLNDNRGFTLIELIAVMLVLGVLASVGAPKYFDMQAEARIKAVQGAVAALQSTVTQEFAAQLLVNPSAQSYAPTYSSIVVGDFEGDIVISASDPGSVTVRVTKGPPWWNTGIVDNEKSFRLY